MSIGASKTVTTIEPSLAETSPDRLSAASRPAARSDRSAVAVWDAEIRALCLDPASRHSNLASVGDPVEFQSVWAATDGRLDLRITADPDPNGSAADRLARCLALAPSLSQQQMGYRDWLVRVQTDGAPRYGGWVGSRLRDGAMHRKLYLEIPAGSSWRDWPAAAPITRPGMPVRALNPIMAGLDPATECVEIYCEIAPLDADALPILLSLFELPPLSRQALELLSELRQQSVRGKMPTEEQGLSLSMDQTGRVTALTWYAHADALLGPPAQIRRALLTVGAAHNWEMDRYRSLSAPDDSGHIPWHGLIGLTISRKAGLLLAATCSTGTNDLEMEMTAVLASQCSNGAFPSEVEGLSDQTCFVTASVALLLDPCEHSVPLSRALDFIERCECVDPPGAFSFYPLNGSTPRLVEALPPDADDTALAWLALLHGGRRSAEEARAAFDSWIAPASRRMVPGDSPPWIRPNAVRTWLVEQGRDNPIDLAVNANVAALAARIGLADHPAFRGACDSLLAAAEGGFNPVAFLGRLSPYYADVSELWLAVRRAVSFGAAELAPVLDWLGPALGPAALRPDKPLYCNAHRAPIWRSPILQAARRLLDHNIPKTSSFTGGH